MPRRRERICDHPCDRDADEDAGGRPLCAHVATPTYRFVIAAKLLDEVRRPFAAKTGSPSYGLLVAHSPPMQSTVINPPEAALVPSSVVTC